MDWIVLSSQTAKRMEFVAPTIKLIAGATNSIRFAVWALRLGLNNTACVIKAGAGNSKNLYEIREFSLQNSVMNLHKSLEKGHF